MNKSTVDVDEERKRENQDISLARTITGEEKHHLKDDRASDQRFHVKQCH